MSGRTRLALGEWVEFEDQRHQVAGFTDSGVRLRSEAGQMQIILVGALLSDPSFHACAVEPATEQSIEDSPGGAANPFGGTGLVADRDAVLLSLPEAERSRVTELEAHLLEVETGYRSGNRLSAVSGEPRAGFDPDHTTLSERIDAKATELGRTSRRLWQLRTAWQRNGLTGLVDKRKTRLHNPLARADTRIIDAIREQAAAERLDSSATIGNRFHRRTQNRLDHQHGVGAVVLPGKDAFRRIVDQVVDLRPSDPAARRIRAAAQPDRTFGVVTATRPGQVVMVDSTGLDVLAYDHDADAVVPVELTLALDLATRSLLAWRFTPRGTKSVDIGLLLADIMVPEPMRPHWPDQLRHAMLHVPTERLLAVDQRLAEAAARPVIYPETLLFDHGKPYQSDVVIRVCRRLGISVQDARKYTPTDKPQVERVFDTINRQFCEHLAGYTGSGVEHRGLHADDTARWSIDDITDLFAEYVVAIYQRRHHKGLILHGFPDLNVSPNQAYTMAIAAAGYVTCPTDLNLYYELLPIAGRRGRTIQPSGVHIGHLTYTAPVLHRYRKTRSPYPDGLWPIRHDPRNLLHAFFHDPADGSWHTLRWTHALDTHQPFTDITLREARRLIHTRGRDDTDQDAVAETLLELQNRADTPDAWTRTARTRWARDTHRAGAHHRDRQRATPTSNDIDDTDTPLHVVEELDLDSLQAADIWDPHHHGDAR